MRICGLFDRYRDHELDDRTRSDFEHHLSDCQECRMRMSLLNNLVEVIRSEERALPGDLSIQIARKAFQKEKSWDALVVSLLRPGTALAALATFIVLFSTLWVVSSRWQQTTAHYEYEKLVDEADAINLESRMSQMRTDTDLVIWLEQEGASR